MKISASIYSERNRPLSEVVQQLVNHQVDMLHIDCKDNPSVFDDIRAIRALTTTPIDLHIISPTPEKYFNEIAALNVDYVSLQWEEAPRTISLPKLPHTKFGIALRTETDIMVLGTQTQYEYVMLMSSTPGESGGQFQKENFQRIHSIRHLFPYLQIEVDGGVNNEVGYILRLLGVNFFVSGSYLMNHHSISSGLLSFHLRPTNCHSFCVRDFMVPLAMLPVLPIHSTSFREVLQTIEDFKQGYVLLTNAAHTLQGIITNADLRRGVLKHWDNLQTIRVSTLMNPSPLHISPDAMLSDLLALLHSLPQIILVLPVVDNGTLVGALHLNNLIRA